MTSIDPIFTDEELDAEIAELWPIEFLRYPPSIPAASI